MVRAVYGHSRNFGRPGNLAPNASFDLLFVFTGNGPQRDRATGKIGAGSEPRDQGDPKAPGSTQSPARLPPEYPHRTKRLDSLTCRRCTREEGAVVVVRIPHADSWLLGFPPRTRFSRRS